MKTGTSMGSITVTKKAKDARIIKYKKAQARTNRAEICLECKDNAEGWCNKHKAWCGRVNYICLGIKDPYEYKVPKLKLNNKNKNSKVKKKKSDNKKRK